MDNFKKFIKSDDYNKVIFDEYEFKVINTINDNMRLLKRYNYKLKQLQNINFPEILLKLVEDLLDKMNLELIINETYTYKNVNYSCSIKSELEQYKFIEDIYYNVDLKCDDNNKINIITSIEKKYNENNINEIDKFLLNILLFFIENNFTEYIKKEIFIKKLNRINLHSFVLNII